MLGESWLIGSLKTSSSPMSLTCKDATNGPRTNRGDGFALDAIRHAPADNALGVKACDFVAALRDENRGVARRRRDTLVRVEPV